ncbi:hypothetical protein [Streptomyces sp. CA-106110]|uniref:hypothetical protein n=1 Tax=Streptomyces sp. CA-106110 TaxID=3240044 RepID=UPI003D8E1ABE
MPPITDTLLSSAAPAVPESPARRKRRRVRLLLWVLMGLLLTGLVWILVTGLMARAELVGSRNDLRTLRSSMTGTGGPASTAERGASRSELALRTARSAAAHAERAHWLTTGPAWYVAARLPFAGGSFKTVRGTAEVVDRLAGKALPAVVRTVGRLTANAGASTSTSPNCAGPHRISSMRRTRRPWPGRRRTGCRDAPGCLRSTGFAVNSSPP